MAGSILYVINGKYDKNKEIFSAPFLLEKDK